MYTVSDSYKNAVKANYRTCYVQGTIQTVTGAKIDFADADISEGTLYVTNQCVSNSDFEYGSVFAGELGMLLRTDADRYTFYDATITLSYFLRIADGTYEEIPLGIFRVEESEREGDYINITAYDNMMLLDKDVAAKQSGTAYKLLQSIAEICGIDLAQNETYFNNLPNGSRILTADPRDLETYRDAVSQIAAVLTGFATINRAGQLEIRQFGGDTVELERNQRFSTKISDFYTYYDSISANFINGEEYQTYTASKEELEGGLSFDMGDMPAVCNNNDSTNIYVLKAIFEQLTTVEYTPYEISYNGNPAIDLGDKIVIKNINGKDEDIESFVMYYDWRYRGKSDLKAMGGNPRIQKRNSFGDSGISSSRPSSASSGNETVVYSFTNSGAITLSSKESKVVSLTFATVEDATPVLVATIPFSVGKDGNVIFNQYLDGVLLNEQVLTQYCDAGKHIITISNSFPVAEGKVKKYEIKALTEYVESTDRVQQAKIDSILNYINTGTYTEQDVDTTIPIGFIQRGAVSAVLFGSSLATEAPWDGTITVTDTVSIVECAEEYTALGISDSLTVQEKISCTEGLAETIGLSSITTAYDAIGYSDTVELADTEV